VEQDHWHASARNRPLSCWSTGTSTTRSARRDSAIRIAGPYLLTISDSPGSPYSRLDYTVSINQLINQSVNFWNGLWDTATARTTEICCRLDFLISFRCHVGTLTRVAGRSQLSELEWTWFHLPSHLPDVHEVQVNIDRCSGKLLNARRTEFWVLRVEMWDEFFNEKTVKFHEIVENFKAGIWNFHWHSSLLLITHCTHYIRLTGFYQDNLGKPAPER